MAKERPAKKRDDLEKYFGMRFADIIKKHCMRMSRFEIADYLNKETKNALNLKPTSIWDWIKKEVDADRLCFEFQGSRKGNPRYSVPRHGKDFVPPHRH